MQELYVYVLKYFYILIVKFFVADNELTQEEAQVKLLEELERPVSERDQPLLRRLFKSTFKLRRTAITTLPDSDVAQLVERFPLMKDVDYVSIIVI